MSKFTKDYTITMKDIVRDGDSILRKKIQEVTFPVNEKTKDELSCMMQFLKNSQDPETAKKLKLRAGVGLSANQVGLDKRMFVVLFDDEKGNHYEYALINPKIISHSETKIHLPDGEGCLSVDEEIEGTVSRYERIKVKAYTPDNKEIALKLKGYAAIVFQHEIDHLNGIMFYDYINKSNSFNLQNLKK